MALTSEVCSIEPISEESLQAVLKPEFDGIICDVKESEHVVIKVKDGKIKFYQDGVELSADQVCRGAKHLAEKLLDGRFPIERLRVHRYAVYCDLQELGTDRPELLLAFERALYAAYCFNKPKTKAREPQTSNSHSRWSR